MSAPSLTETIIEKAFKLDKSSIPGIPKVSISFFYPSKASYPSLGTQTKVGIALSLDCKKAVEEEVIKFLKSLLFYPKFYIIKSVLRFMNIVTLGLLEKAIE